MSNRPSGRVSYDNSERIVIVTGGSGGIGWAICEKFAMTNAIVYCFDTQSPPESKLPIHFIHNDVSDESACQASIETVVQQHGGIDVLVNNAAIQPVESFVPLDQLDGELWTKMLAVNVSGYTFMAKHVVRQMKKQNSGVIVNLSSAQAHRTAREVPAYGPTKAANLLQAKQWGIEYGRHGIRVVSVSPGAIDTPLVRASLELQGGEAELANRHPIGRIGKPDEIATAVVWLSSSDASFITAEDLAVDGGLGGLAAFADPYEPID
ncbi:SDR family oxidoreductase [Pirellulaceae bacterium]|jgi:NAD(P)-dependent dehydrogenase (short-subunit alcohol dehydrogenase family)|nr:SDR family oxidoreductase [Pirellulaceae bacterium]